MRAEIRKSLMWLAWVYTAVALPVLVLLFYAVYLVLFAHG